MTTEETLLKRYGGSPLLSLVQVAEVFHRSPEGFRMTLRSDNDLAHKLLPNKVKIGRRVYFKVSDIAEIIDHS